MREHPDLQNSLRRAAQQDRLARILPGVYADPAAATDFRTRVAAVTRWDPSAVICGRAAAVLSYWSELTVGPVQVASPVRHRAQSGFEFTERRIPPDLVQVRDGVRLTAPSLTAVELATTQFTDPIDIALRKVTLASMKVALSLTAGRRGHLDRRLVLLDSRAEPWSAAERLAHRLYRQAGIAGWRSNHRVAIPDSGTYYLDIAFLRQRLATEIDGRIHQEDRELFESDRLRQNALVLEGWSILRFTWRMLDRDPDYVIRTTRRTLRLRD
ncbi:MAG: endonuclease domain-containing protein [Microlunatus sp.]|nr:endonuclease domain-containing protein [Microlunatus sp.]